MSSVAIPVVTLRKHTSVRDSNPGVQTHLWRCVLSVSFSAVLTRNTKLQSGRTSRQLALVKRFGYGSIARQIDLLREHVAMSPYTIQASLYYISSRRSATVKLPRSACAIEG